ncbi:2547_t:CDS:2 [Gigaspora margarita]|uniref:2547_t:CDS:1 n=1 Tax=Gigaspora margarita TaxID=4874 RepID=A0ABN7VC23_GIGMA|nr:2547_t:CDS:2 [Gigaspora margarita]
MSQTTKDTTLTGNRQSPHDNNTISIQSAPPDITHPVHFTLEPSQLLKIITYNVQGLGANIKFQQWLEYCNKQKAHIISMTETKCPEFTTLYISLTNPFYKIYTVNCDTETAIQREASMGTALALHSNLQPYIYSIDKVPGMAIIIDLYLPQNHKTRIISIKSQIDDIWPSYSILLDVSEPELSTSDESTKSDHKILSIEWNTEISLKMGHKKRSKRKIYMYDRVTTDNWTKFSDDLTKKMEELQLHSPII